MIPVVYVEATSTMHLAFGDSVDHSLLYAGGEDDGNAYRALPCASQICTRQP